jgi:hypothetical protein
LGLTIAELSRYRELALRFLVCRIAEKSAPVAPMASMEILIFDAVIQGKVRLADLSRAVEYSTVPQTEPHAIADADPVAMDTGHFLLGRSPRT